MSNDPVDPNQLTTQAELDSQTDDVLEKNVTNLLSGASTPPQISDLGRARVRAALVATHGRARKKRTSWIVGGAIATAAAAAVAVWYVAGHRHAPTVVPLLAAATGAQRTFADGSTVWLREGASLTELGPRHVKVSGEILFDVAPGAGPFTVDSDAAQISVLGTRFVVDASPQATSAAVIRGVVTLGNAQGNVTLHAGDQGQAQLHTVPVRGPAPRLSQLVGWAQAARARDERGLRPAVRNGSLYARMPNSQTQETPLPMTQLRIDVVIENRVARVALDQTFLNPAPYEQEGMYRFAIPADAALQRFAMYVDGTLTEAVVTDRMRARRVYEDLVYRRIDPGLLEYAGAGRLEMKIYPLRASAEKRLAVVYTQALPQLYDTWTLRVPIPDVDQPVEQVDVAVRIANCATCEVRSTSHQINIVRTGQDVMVSYAARNVKVGDSLVLHVRDAAAQTTVATATDSHGDYMLVRAPLRLDTSTAAVYQPRTWVILNDVSASRSAMDRRAQAEIIDRALQEIDEDDQVAVLSFDVNARVSLPMVKVRAADRKQLAETLLKQETGGVGATDLGAAVDAALLQFDAHAAGQAASNRMLMYIGDGVLTAGVRQLDGLRAKLVGRAQFIGMGVGTGVETANLQALAAATDGYATELDLSEDLAWRTFDAIAALHTTRVGQVTVTPVDANGAPVPNLRGYLRSAQLAQGEELEWVAHRARAAGAVTDQAPQAVALMVQGVSAGAPWTTRVELDLSGPRTMKTAGYVARLWAQRHIAARMLAKQEPAPPCQRQTGNRSAVMCPSDAQRRETRDEAIRLEVVALGKEYFLLSRHTSLLVLEAGAGDRTNTVQGNGQTWASYALPAKVVVKTRPSAGNALPIAPVVVTDAGLLWRTPQQMFYDPSRGYGDESGGLLMLGHGAGRAGGGTGTGFGIGSGFGTGGPVVTMMVEDKADASRAREAEAGPPPIDVAVSEPSATTNGDNAEGKAASSDVLSKTADPDRDTGTSTASPAGYFGGNRRGTRGPPFGGIAGESQGYTAGAYLQRYTAISDALFDDLTEYLPASMVDGLSYHQRWLEAQRGDDAKAVAQRDPAALALLAQARQALLPGTYTWGERTITVDTGGQLAWQTTTGFGLVEQALYDRRSVGRRYPELQLQFDRPIAGRGVDELALALGNLPIWLGNADSFATQLSVSKPAPNQVALTWPGTKLAVVVYEFDAQHRVIAVRDRVGAMVRITWNDRGPATALVMGRRVQVGLQTTAVVNAAATVGWTTTGTWTTVGLPLLAPAQHALVANKAGVGSAPWLIAKRQQLAALAATLAATSTGNGAATTWAVLDELLQARALTTGDLVLASAAVRSAPIAKFTAWLNAVTSSAASLPQCGILGPPCMLGSVIHDPDNRLVQPDIITYLTSRRAARATRLTATTGLLATLHTLATISGNYQLGAARVAAVQAIASSAHTARLIAATLVQQDYRVSTKVVAATWDAIAEGPNRNWGRWQAALIWMRDGRSGYNQAAARFASYMSDVDTSVAIPALGYQAFAAMTNSTRGVAGWQLGWASMRERIIADGDLPAALDLLAAWTYGNASLQEADRSRILDKAWGLAGGHPATIVPLLTRATNANAAAWALLKLEAVMPQVTGEPAVHRFASNLYASQMQPHKAREQLELALEGEAEAPVVLQQARADYYNLLTWLGSEANASAISKADARVRMLAIGQQWRAIDGANPMIDNAVADGMFAIGATDEAWRQLSTAIERQPLAATGWVMVAEAYQRHANITEALKFWHEAVILDQTNPRWRIKEAQALIAGGQTDAGRKLLRETLNARWHQQYQWELEDARYLLNPGSYR